MPSQMTEKDNLDLAKSILLDPFGLDEPALIKAMGTIFNHQVDYADLYFQFTKNESWSLEEGIVKTGSFAIDQGVGVRAVAGDKTAFSCCGTGRCCQGNPYYRASGRRKGQAGVGDKTGQESFPLHSK